MGSSHDRSDPEAFHAAARARAADRVGRVARAMGSPFRHWQTSQTRLTRSKSIFALFAPSPVRNLARVFALPLDPDLLPHLSILGESLSGSARQVLLRTPLEVAARLLDFWVVS